MAFSFFKWLFQRGGEAQTVTAEEFFDVYAECYVRELAFEACANLVANALSKCELQTYQNGKPIQGAEHYLWNVSPNQNQNSTAFFQKLVHQLFKEREVLVIQNDGKRYVADSYSRKPYALYDDVFSQVTVGDFTFRKTFAASDVLFFELTAENMKRITDGLYESYGKLIAYGMKGYQRSRGEKGTLEMDTTLAGDQKFQETFAAIKNGGFKAFAEAENAMMPLYRGMKYTSLGTKTYNADTTRDIRSMIDDVTDFTARAFGIPPSLLNGSVQDVSSAMEQFLTFCLDPLANNLAEEINRKLYGQRMMAAGSYVRFDTNQIKHVDILENASNITQLAGSGVVCINDIRVLLGQPLIDEPWAWKPFITKNFSTVEDLIAELEKTATV